MLFVVYKKQAFGCWLLDMLSKNVQNQGKNTMLKVDLQKLTPDKQAKKKNPPFLPTDWAALQNKPEKNKQSATAHEMSIMPQSSKVQNQIWSIRDGRA